MEVHFFVDRPHSMPQRQARALLIDLLSDVLERVAYGEDAGEVADLLCRRAEILAPGAICSILCVDEELKLRPLAAPSLPAHYSEALDGLPIGLQVVGRHFSEELLLDLALTVERNRPWPLTTGSGALAG